MTQAVGDRLVDLNRYFLVTNQGVYTMNRVKDKVAAFHFLKNLNFSKEKIMTINSNKFLNKEFLKSIGLILLCGSVGSAIAGVPSKALAADCVSILSDSGPSAGQTSRSSSNFRLPLSLKYQVKAPPGIVFKLREDIRFASDPDIVQKLRNGDILVGRSDKQLYIAEPKGAVQQFTVTFCLIKK
jgi:hypothetical protein